MTYRQSKMYNCAKYLKNLPLQSVSSRENLQVIDKFPEEIYIYIYKTFSILIEHHIISKVLNTLW